MKPRISAKNKKRIRHLSAPSPTSTSKKYKKKKFVEPNPRPDGSIDADDLIDLPRLNEMFNRYMSCYEDATKDKTGRFGGILYSAKLNSYWALNPLILLFYTFDTFYT